MLNISNIALVSIATASLIILREFSEFILRETAFFMNSIYNCNIGLVFFHLAKLCVP